MKACVLQLKSFFVCPAQSNRKSLSTCVPVGWGECRGAGCCSSGSSSVSVWGHGSQPVRDLGAKPLQAHRPWALQHFRGLRPTFPASLRGEERRSWHVWIQQWLRTGVSDTRHHCPLCSSRPYSDNRSPFRARSPQTTAHRWGPGWAARITACCDQKWD